MRLLVITFLAFTRLSWVEGTSGITDPPARIATGPKPVRAAVASWLRKELDLLTHFMKVSGVQEESVRDLTEFSDSIIASPNFSDNKLRIVSQVFDVIRNEYISGTLPDNNQLLLCAIRAELEYHVGPHSKITFYNELTERSKRVIDLVRLRDRVLPSLWNTSDLLLTSFYERTLWISNVLSIEDAELNLLDSSLRMAVGAADDLSVEKGVDVRDCFPPLSIVSLYTSSQFDSLGQEIRLIRLARFSAVSANKEMLDMAVTWGRIFSSSCGAVASMQTPEPVHFGAEVSTSVYAIVHFILGACMNGQQIYCDASRSLGKYLQTLGRRLGSFKKESNLRSSYYGTVTSLPRKIVSGEFHTAAIDAIVTDIRENHPIEIEAKRLNGEQLRLVDNLNSSVNVNDSVNIRLKRLIRDLIGWDSKGSDPRLNLMVAEAVIHKLPELDETERLWVDRILSKWMRNHKSPKSDTSERDDFSMMIELYKWTSIVANVEQSRIIKLVASIADVSMFSERSRNDLMKRYGDAGYIIDATDHDFSGISSINIFSIISYSPEKLPIETLEAYRTVMLDFQSKSPAISGFIPEAVFRYLGSNVAAISGQLTHWRATERKSDHLFNAITQGIPRNLPSIPTEVMRYIREMNNPLKLVDALVERVESVYRNKLEDLLALMRRFPQLESSNYIRALTGMPRAIWYTLMNGGLIERRADVRFTPLIAAVMSTGMKLIEVFESVPSIEISNETINETCLVSLIQTLQDWTHLCTSHGRLVDSTSPVTDEQIDNSISQFVRVTSILDGIAEARFMSCEPVEPAPLITIGTSQSSCSYRDGLMGTSSRLLMETFFHSEHNKNLNAYQLARPYPDLSEACQRCIDGIVLRARGREEALISTWHNVPVPGTLVPIELEYRDLCFTPGVLSTLRRSISTVAGLLLGGTVGLAWACLLSIV